MGQKDELENKNDVVLKLDLHCEGCVKKIKRALLRFDGVEDVKPDTAANKLTVIGKVDPIKVRDKLADKIKKNVELVSSPPKKAAAAAVDKPPPAKNNHDDDEEKKKKPDDKKTDEKPLKQSVENTVVLKIRLHCDACIKKIEKIILKFKGVDSVNIDGGKDLVTIKGATDAKEIVPYLTEKLKRDVEVIQPKKEEDNKKNKEKKEEGGGEKKEGGKAKVEVNKMEHYGYGQQPPMYWYDGYEPGQSSSSNRVEVQPGYSYSNQQGQNYNYANQGGYNYNNMNMNHNHHQQGYDYSYGNQGYMVEPQQPPFYLHPNHPPPQMFSDENPNACSMM